MSGIRGLAMYSSPCSYRCACFVSYSSTATCLVLSIPKLSSPLRVTNRHAVLSLRTKSLLAQKDIEVRENEAETNKKQERDERVPTIIFTTYPPNESYYICDTAFSAPLISRNETLTGGLKTLSLRGQPRPSSAAAFPQPSRASDGAAW